MLKIKPLLIVASFCPLFLIALQLPSHAQNNSAWRSFGKGLATASTRRTEKNLNPRLKSRLYGNE